MEEINITILKQIIFCDEDKNILNLIEGKALIQNLLPKSSSRLMTAFFYFIVFNFFLNSL